MLKGLHELLCNISKCFGLFSNCNFPHFKDVLSKTQSFLVRGKILLLHDVERGELHEKELCWDGMWPCSEPWSKNHVHFWGLKDWRLWWSSSRYWDCLGWDIRHTHFSGAKTNRNRNKPGLTSTREVTTPQGFNQPAAAFQYKQRFSAAPSGQHHHWELFKSGPPCPEGE